MQRPSLTLKPSIRDANFQEMHNSSGVPTRPPTKLMPCQNLMREGKAERGESIRRGMAKIENRSRLLTSKRANAMHNWALRTNFNTHFRNVKCEHLQPVLPVEDAPRCITFSASSSSLTWRPVSLVYKHIEAFHSVSKAGVLFATLPNTYVMEVPRQLRQLAPRDNC